MYNSIAYILYLACSAIVVFWVGRILHRNGKAYLFEECPDKSISEAANNLLYIGYCLLNTGFAFYFLRNSGQLNTPVEVLEFVSGAEGFVLLVLAVMHILNMLFAPKIITLFIPKQTHTNL